MAPSQRRILGRFTCPSTKVNPGEREGWHVLLHTEGRFCRKSGVFRICDMEVCRGDSEPLDSIERKPICEAVGQNESAHAAPFEVTNLSH